MGVFIDIDKINLTRSIDIKDDKGNFIGELRSACYSPHFKKAIGIAMINEPYCKAVCDLPFI